jgi:hypothetical protein
LELSVQRRLTLPGFDVDADRLAGAVMALMSLLAVMATVVDFVAPRLSVTVRVAVYAPAST